MEKDNNTAKAKGNNLPISTKQSIEICSFVKGKTVAKAKKLLEGVIAKKVAVPFTRFNRDTGHKKGKIAAGRYPINAASYILEIIESAESNAMNKGLGADLFIKLAIANQGNAQWHYGRQRRRRMKRTHIEIVVTEIFGKKNKKTEQPVKNKKTVKVTNEKKTVIKKSAKGTMNNSESKETKPKAENKVEEKQK